jgi:hypothetical protein
MSRNPSEENYGNSRFRQFDTFASSGIRTVHATPETSSRPPAVQKRGATMKPMDNMNYQETHRRPMAGKKTSPPTGVGDDGFMNDLAEEMGCDEFEPMTSEEKHTAELFLRDEWGSSESNVF